MKRIKSVFTIFLLLTFLSFNFNAHIQASASTTISMIPSSQKRVSVETIKKMDRINKAENLFDIQIDDLLTMDEIFACIESFPDEDDDDFEEIYTEEELKIINTFFIFLARLGVSPEDAEQLEKDIEELLSDEDKEYSFASPIDDNRPHMKISKAYDSSFTFNTRSSSDYANKKNIVLCTNIFKKMGRGIKKGAKESGRFVKNNWKPIAIGSSALAVGAVIYVIASSKPSEPSFPTSLQKETIKTEKENNSTIQKDVKDVPNQDSTTTLNSENKNPLLTQVLEDSVQTFKMDLQKDNSFNQQQTNPTVWQNTKGTIKEYSGYFAHTILDEVSDYAKIIPEGLSFTNLKEDSEKKVSEGHQKIDQIFATNLSENNDKIIESSLAHEALWNLSQNIQDKNLQENTHYFQGQEALKAKYYDKAVDSFGKALESTPNNHNIYLDRAFAYLQAGEFDHSLNDYNAYKENEQKNYFSQSLDVLKDSGAFYVGARIGLDKGVIASGKQLLLFATNALAHPIDTSYGIYEAFSSLYKLACSQEWNALGQALVPEVYQLIDEWETLSSKEKGDRSGYILGKLGGDILIPGITAKLTSKGIKGAKELTVIAKNLQKTEKIIVLEALAESGGSSGTFKEIVHSNRVLESVASTGKLIEGFSIKQLTEAGKVFDRSGLTKAGRALAKHGGREGSVFPNLKGNPMQINQQGQKILEKILNDPKRKIIPDGNIGFEIYLPDGQGAYFKKDGTLRGFVEWKKK
ncbi:MAG: hypothetical protein K1000chlam1_00477 [Candidatus Anoxychlamydiales bacterium]|nr:hypothetical protein [Candidatus Anoxychlamydiales bacterium]